NSLPEFENFYFDLGEISSGSTTTHSDIFLLDYEAFSFNNDHVKKISSGSTTTHSDIFLLDYEAFSFNNDHVKKISSGSTTTHLEISLSEYDSFIFNFANVEFVDELAHIISPSEIRENLSSITSVNLLIEDDHSPLLAYVVWIFVAYLTYPVIPPYLHPFGNEDTIFDPNITINHFYSCEPVSSHR
nr:hypothetical protein [Tanacetum cinerariifolium]